MEPFNYWQALKNRQFKQWYAIPEYTEGRQLVIGDIHGCAKTFKALIERVGLSRKDQLFLLGDYINRGPDSAGVIDFILELLSRGYSILPVRGNHEELLLHSHQHPKAPNYLTNSPLKKKPLVDKSGRILPKYLPFFSHLPYYYELPNYYIVHGGFDFAKANPYESYLSMPWIRPFDPSSEQLGGKQAIVGHAPKVRPVINQHIYAKNPVIPLDNGCVFKQRALMGQLLCLDLSSLDITAQPNID